MSPVTDLRAGGRSADATAPVDREREIAIAAGVAQAKIRVEADDRGRGNQQAVDVMKLNQARRIALANSVTQPMLAAISIWVTVLAASKYRELGVETIGVLNMIGIFLPLMASAFCLILMAVSRGLWKAECSTSEDLFCYEKVYMGGLGHAHSRYREVTQQSTWIPSTTDIATQSWFLVWTVLGLGARYYLG